MWGIGEISLLDSIAFAILSLFLLYMTGQSLLWLLCKIGKKSDPFSSCDIYQRINYRIMFGMSFAVLFLTVFSAFNFSFFIKSLLLLGITLGILAINYAPKFRQNIFQIKSLRRISTRTLIRNMPLLIMLSVILFLSANLIMGYYGSTNDDGAFHTFIVRVLLDNPNMLLSGSTQPYAGFIDTYPFATHTLSAFFVSVLNVPIQKIIIMFSAVLPTLIALSFYSNINFLFKNKILAILGAFISAFLTFDYSWGPLSWGGLPLLLSIFITSSSMGLIFSLFEKKQVDWLDAALIGLIFFTTIQTYSVAFFYTLLWSSLLIAVKLFKKIRHRVIYSELKSSIFKRKNLTLFAAFLIPVMFCAPYFYVVYNSSNPSLQNYPADINFDELTAGRNSIFESVRQRIGFNWLFDVPALSTFFAKFGTILYLAPYSLFLIPALYLASISKTSILGDLPRKVIRNLSLIYVFFLSIMLYLTFSTSLEIGGLFWFFDPDRVLHHIFVSGVILTSIILFFAGYCVYIIFKRLSRNHVWRGISNPKRARLASAILLSLLFLNLGLASASCLTEFQEKYNERIFYLNRFSTLQNDDIELMSWIKENTPTDAIFLVTAGDSGQYLTAVSQRKSIYSHSVQLYSKKYEYLIAELSSQPFNPYLVPLLLDYNISYVYIGSKATTYSLEDPFRAHFNATKFLYTPYFNMTKRVGDAWLFQLDRQLATEMYNQFLTLDKAYYWDDRYPSKNVINLLNISIYLENHSFERLNADELSSWMTRHIIQNTASESTLVMIMGVAPDTVVERLYGNTLLRRYLNMGGRITWIGDVPFFYQGHKDKTFTPWGNYGPLNIIGVEFEFWDFNATAATVTMDGLRWGLFLPDFTTSQRPVSKTYITTPLSETDGYAYSWHKNFNVAFPYSGFIQCNYQDYDGSDNDRNRGVLNLATLPPLLERVNKFSN